MSFTVTDLHDLLRLLREHQEWRDAVRRELLSDDFLALPQAVRELAEAQAATERRLAELAEAQAATERRLAELAEAQAATERQLAELTRSQNRLEGRIGNLEGLSYERRYVENAASRLAPHLRRIERVHVGHLDVLLDALDRGQISEREWYDVAALDLLVRGRAGRGAEAPERYLALEISTTVDRNDVMRAHDRAAILARVGLPVEACVAGRSIEPEAEEAARTLGVRILVEHRAA